jgi:hypothetical protein
MISLALGNKPVMMPTLTARLMWQSTTAADLPPILAVNQTAAIEPAGSDAEAIGTTKPMSRFFMRLSKLSWVPTRE